MTKRCNEGGLGSTVSELRGRAEALVAQSPGHAGSVDTDVAEVVHELRVHQIELEMQNDELRHGQDQLAQSRDAYRELYDHAPVGYLTLDARGVCLDANLTAATMLGRARAELISRPLTALLSEGEGDHLSRHVYATLTEHKPQTVEVALRRGGDRERYLRLDSVPVRGHTWPACRTTLTDVSERHRLLDELRELNRTLEGRVIERTDALRRANEKLERQLVERKQIEDELARARKLEAIGRLAGGVAHDFNNLLTIMKLELPPLACSVAGNPALERCSDALGQAVERAGALTSRLLAFARREVVRPVSLDLSAVIHELEPMLERLLASGIELVVDLPPRPTWVFADRAGLERVVLNLVTNARDATEGRGRVAIELREVDLDEDAIRRLVGTRPGAYVCATVRDDGCGMSADELAHIFEPFFTTKSPDQGSGLGLATAYGIITEADGLVEVESARGEGTAVSVYLPRARAAPIPARAREAAPDRGGSETILLVDDQRPVRAALARALRGVGYTVLEGGSSADGLSALDERDGRVDLVVSDVVMPGQSGVDMAREIAGRYPELPVILISGYTDDQVVDAGIPFLHKPIDSETLFRAVREALDLASSVAAR